MTDDYLPLSMLNQLEYCPRRFWLMHVCGEMAVNAPVLEGTLQHQRVHTAGAETTAETRTHRRLYVFSHRLRVAGFADVVEEVQGVLCPVEHKHGHKGQWRNDEVQLCAQALCLEERLAETTAPPTGLQAHIPHGEIFYWGSRRRQVVLFSPALRAYTEAAIARAFALLQAGHMPAPIAQRQKCRECSLQPICLPDEVTLLNTRQP